MTLIQILALVAGGLIILSYFVNFKRIFIKMSNDKKEDLVIPNDKPIALQPKTAEIVEQWDKLRNMCQSSDLIEATAKLEEVFPLFVKKG